MGSGAGPGIVHSSTFTPAYPGKCVVTCVYEAQGTSGGDWGSAYHGRCFVTQDGTTTYGNSMPMSTTRAQYAARFVFDVIADEEIEYGLHGNISGAVAATFWNIDISAHLIKG